MFHSNSGCSLGNFAKPSGLPRRASAPLYLGLIPKILKKDLGFFLPLPLLLAECESSPKQGKNGKDELGNHYCGTAEINCAVKMDCAILEQLKQYKGKEDIVTSVCVLGLMTRP